MRELSDPLKVAEVVVAGTDVAEAHHGSDTLSVQQLFDDLFGSASRQAAREVLRGSL